MRKIFVLLLALITFFAAPVFAQKEPLKISHTVKNGETLWWICARYADAYGDKRDIRQIIYDVEGAQGSFLDVGQIIVINLEVDPKGAELNVAAEESLI